MLQVRPLFEHVNKVSKINYNQQFSSIDEIMIPYYGRHGDKQFIRGKPIRFGFKLWAVCTSDGTLLHVEPYCGCHTKIHDTGLGQGPNVVLEMIDQINLEPGQHVIVDNLFTSLPLLENLTKRGIGVTGTLREDRLHGAPLMPRKEMEKKDRGYMEQVFSEKTSIVKWKDNKVLSVASNHFRSDPVQKAIRWSKIEKKYIEVDMPNSIKVYNTHMGGVDLFDQQVAAYRTRIRSKKWWWSLFAWSVNAQVTNAWRLFRHLDNDISLLNFMRHFVVAIMRTCGVSRIRPGPKISLGIAGNTVRFDGTQHWTARGEQPNSRCRQCSGRTVFVCKRCAQAVHPECMEKYHTRE